MSKKSSPAETTVPGVAGFKIDEHSVYLPTEIQAALRLRPSSLRTEWRRGRLTIRRRCGRNFILGSDLIVWLRGGELRRRSARIDDSDR
jgi:hypothetical protein